MATFTGTGVPLSQTFTQTGAFPLTAGSADAAMAVGLQPGPYSVVVSGGSATETGDVLVEVYYIQ